ncbi:MAG: hypothetical protein ACO2ZZ_14085 [Cyclobacteriaceae bacterium]
MSDPDESPEQRQCTHEIKTLLHRWEEESDMTQEEILQALNTALDEYYGEDVIEFECDFELEADDDE